MLSLIFRHHYAKRIGFKGLSMHADPKGRAEVLDFGIAQAIHTGIFKYMRNPAAPFFDNVHVQERCADGDIPHTRIAFDQLPLVRSGFSLPGDVTSNKIIISESAIRFNQRKMKKPFTNKILYVIMIL